MCKNGRVCLEKSSDPFLQKAQGKRETDLKGSGILEKMSKKCFFLPKVLIIKKKDIYLHNILDWKYYLIYCLTEIKQNVSL